MNIIVCIKQVPSSNEVHLDPVTHTLVRDGRNSVINPFDSFAVEEAVRIKEALGGKVTVLSMGIPAVESLLRDAVSRGADEAVLLTDRAFAGADTLATSYALSLGVQAIGAYDLILCGKMAVDGDTAQIGPELAETLGIPHVTEVRSILSISEQELICLKVSDGEEQQLKVKLPALLTVLKDINMPRLPSIPGVKRGLAAECRILSATDVAADKDRCGLSGSPTQVVATFVPQRNQATVEIYGSAAEQASELISILQLTGAKASMTDDGDHSLYATVHGEVTR